MALADTARLVASLELEDKFSRTADRYNTAIGGMERRTTSAFGQIGASASRGIGTLTTNLLKIGTIATGVAVGGIIASVHAASDLNEEIDKSKVVFGAASEEVLAFSKNAASIGLAQSEALGAAGAFGNMFNTIGLAQDASAEMSVRMVQLAADMASFNNEDPNEMLLKLRSGLAGEAEPLRRFGVLLSEAAVKEFAYRTGIAAVGDALTEQQKVQARYGLILEQTAIQQGNFADTSDSLANQQRILRANLKNTAAVIGTAFLPSLSRVSVKINEAFIDNQPQIVAFADRLGDSLERVFTDENITRGIGAISDFVAKLSQGDVSGVFANVQSFIGGLASLPWGPIGDAAALLGTGSKALLDAFLGMPPWVQTAVLTGWGLNKLTGGALDNIVGALASGLIKGVLGINAGVVNINAATVAGGTAGGTVAAAGGGIITKILGIASAAVLGAILGSEIGHAIFYDPTVRPAVEFEDSQFQQLLESGDPAAMQRGLDAINAGLADLDELGPLKILAGDQYDILVQQRDALQALLDSMPSGAPLPSPANQGGSPLADKPIPVILPADSSNDLSQSQQFLDNIKGTTQRTYDTSARIREGITTSTAVARSATAARAVEAGRMTALQTLSLFKLQQIAAKPAPTVNVSQVVNVDGRTVVSATTRTTLDTYAKLREG